MTEFCPTCKSQDKAWSPHYVGAIPYKPTSLGKPNCPDPWHEGNLPKPIKLGEDRQ